MYDYPNSVEEAAKILDEAYPGWTNLVDVNILNLSSDKNCVLGQVTGDYCETLHKLFPDRRGNLFSSRVHLEDWKAEIIKRQQQDEQKGQQQSCRYSSK